MSSRIFFSGRRKSLQENAQGLAYILEEEILAKPRSTTRGETLFRREEIDQYIAETVGNLLGTTKIQVSSNCPPIRKFSWSSGPLFPKSKGIVQTLIFSKKTNSCTPLLLGKIGPQNFRIATFTLFLLYFPSP